MVCECEALSVTPVGDMLYVNDIPRGISIAYDNTTEDYVTSVHAPGMADAEGLGLALSTLDSIKGKPRADGMVKIMDPRHEQGQRGYGSYWLLPRETALMVIKAWKEIDYQHCLWCLEHE